MRFKIHRGAHEVGGNCVEIEADGISILLDLGLPLDDRKINDVTLPDVAGLTDGTNPDLLGIVVSHPHIDHYGLLEKAHHSIPVFMGQGAHNLLMAAAPFTPLDAVPENVIHYKDRQTFKIGPFHITPYLVDHSGFDAYALLVEADGQRLFYSGDFRAHGRKASLFKTLLKNTPDKIDVLILEGTILGREDDEGRQNTESDLENRILNSIESTEGPVLACFSAQNIDRFVTFYRAAKRAGRFFVADAYLAAILDGIGLPSLPSPASSDMRVYLPIYQKVRIKRQGRFDLIDRYRKSRIYPEQLASSPQKWVMIFRSSMIKDFEGLGELSGTKLIYSLWPGYLERGSPDLREWCASNEIAFEIQHTSGHADRDTMKRLVEGLSPDRIVPIHSSNPDHFKTMFTNAELHDDGQWGDVLVR